MPSSNSNALVSVIIPAHNAARFIGFTLQSIMRQSHENLEIIVIDDGSTDNTLETVRGYASMDSRIAILRQKNNTGVAAARNRGIEASSGSFIAPVDADDIWHPTAVTKMLRRFEQPQSNLAVVYAWSLDIDEENCATGGVHASRSRGYVYPLLVFHNFIGNASSTMIEASRLKSVGGYRTEFNIGCEDLDLYLRLAETCNYDFVPEFLVGYRRHLGSMSSNTVKLDTSHTQVIEKLRREHPGLPAFLFRLSKINFYVHLARITAGGGADRCTFYWLRKAFKTDIFLSFLRIDFLHPICTRLFSIVFPGKKELSRSAKSHNLVEECPTENFSPPPRGYLLLALKTWIGSALLFVVRRLERR